MTFEAAGIHGYGSHRTQSLPWSTSVVSWVLVFPLLLVPLLAFYTISAVVGILDWGGVTGPRFIGAIHFLIPAPFALGLAFLCWRYYEDGLRRWARLSVGTGILFLPLATLLTAIIFTMVPWVFVFAGTLSASGIRVPVLGSDQSIVRFVVITTLLGSVLGILGLRLLASRLTKPLVAGISLCFAIVTLVHVVVTPFEAASYSLGQNVHDSGDLLGFPEAFMPFFLFVTFLVLHPLPASSEARPIPFKESLTYYAGGFLLSIGLVYIYQVGRILMFLVFGIENPY